jgi:hypothetical protein
MKRTPEELEKYIHQTLRALPARRAPVSLESRVRAAIEARAALPWWKQSFARWPLAARVAFFVASAGVAKLAIMAVVWAMAGFDGAQFAGAFSTEFAWLQTASDLVDRVSDFCGVIYRGIPPLWLYGGVAFVAIMYAALLGLGTAAYRLLYAQR